MSERNPKRFENGSNAQQRSPEEQRRLMEEYDQARYEEAAGDEAAYNEAMAAREAQAHEDELNAHAETEARVMENAETRRMYMIAQQIAELRDKGGEPEIITDKENLLQELLVNYTNQAYADRDIETRNAEINATSTVKGKEREEAQKRAAEEVLAEKIRGADFILESMDNAWVKEKLTSPKEAKEAAADLEKDRVKDIEEARLLANVEELSRRIKADPEKAKEMGVYDELRKIKAEIDAALAGVGEPKDVKLKDEEIGEPKSIDLGDDEIGEPKDVDLKDEGEIGEPKDADIKDDGEDKVEKDEIGEPRDVNLVEPTPVDDHESDDDDEERRGGIISRTWYKLGAYFTRGQLAFERFASTRRGKAAMVIGALALAGGIIAARHYGIFGGGGGNSDHNPSDVTGGTGGHGQTPGEFQTPAPVVTGPEIPNGANYAHPWNWMNAAIENGSIKPPQGMDAEQALHHYGDIAAQHNHKVEWYSLPNGLEAVRVDGSDDSADVARVLGQFAK